MSAAVMSTVTLLESSSKPDETRDGDKEILGHAFRVLFENGLSPKPPRTLIEAWKKLGYRYPQSVEQKLYPVSVYRECVELARRHYFPALSYDEGMLALGRASALGATKSRLGDRFIRLLRFTGPAVQVWLYPWMMTQGRPGLRVKAESVGSNHHRMVMHTERGDALLAAGSLEFDINAAKNKAKVIVTEADPGCYHIDVHVLHTSRTRKGHR